MASLIFGKTIAKEKKAQDENRQKFVKKPHVQQPEAQPSRAKKLDKKPVKPVKAAPRKAHMAWKKRRLAQSPAGGLKQHANKPAASRKLKLVDPDLDEEDDAEAAHVKPTKSKRRLEDIQKTAASMRPRRGMNDK